MEARMQTVTISIPPSVRAEHREIHAALERAASASGSVGAAARALAEVLHPHFVREEEIALPPLGLLGPLAAGERPAEMPAALAMSDSLRRELPRMLEEHARIRAAVEALRAAAQEERVANAERLADQLALHAQTEEEVLYPAAILVGDIIRTRLGRE
jgi:iron-sulfur cluster repair protein YtfE (RIC family)